IWTRLKRPRVVGYGLILLIIMVSWIIGIMNRQNVRVDVIKDRGVMVRYNNEGLVENSYTLRLLNASDKVQVINANVEGIEGIKLTGIANDFELNPGDPVSLPVQVSIPPEMADTSNGKSQHIYFKFSYHTKGEDGTIRTFDEKAAFIKGTR
ncbi:MAG: cytochrome c oxidase accessory protein CcoG, partial [Neisseriaceae bacterium]|nr:cytochrome c oxidase accessory protein CcoG [Neisseriaceae bacterium]